MQYYTSTVSQSTGSPGGDATHLPGPRDRQDALEALIQQTIRHGSHIPRRALAGPLEVVHIHQVRLHRPRRPPPRQRLSAAPLERLQVGAERAERAVDARALPVIQRVEQRVGEARVGVLLGRASEEELLDRGGAARVVELRVDVGEGAGDALGAVAERVGVHAAVDLLPVGGHVDLGLHGGGCGVCCGAVSRCCVGGGGWCWLTGVDGVWVQVPEHCSSHAWV